MASNKSFGLLSLFSDLHEFVRGIGKVANAAHNGSLPEFLKSTNVEPICLIESNLAYQDIANNICSMALDITAIMYLKVFSRLMTVDINAVHVTRMLEKLATERDLMGTLAAMEDDSIDFISAGLLADDYGRDKKDRNRDPKFNGVETNSKAYSPITDNTNLSVGKLLNCSVTNGKEKLDIPISIRLRTKQVQPKLIKDIFEANYANLNIYQRIKLYNLNETTFLEALTACNEVSQQERIRLADKDGVIRSHFMDAAKDVGYMALTGEVPINRASGIMIISDETAAMIGRTAHLRLDRYKDREKFFEGTATMMIIVVSMQDEVCDMYLRGYKDGSTETFRRIQSNSTKSQQDLTPVIKDLLQGQIPSL